MDPFSQLEVPGWSIRQVNQYWHDLHEIVRLPIDRLLEVLDDLSLDLPTWLLMIVFQTVWTSVLATRPAELRQLRLPFEGIEQRGHSEGLDQSVAICRDLCPYLREIIDEDLNWTDLRLPGDD